MCVIIKYYKINSKDKIALISFVMRLFFLRMSMCA